MQLTNLTTKYLGKKCTCYEEIDSTQSEIFRLIEKNEIQNGELIIANTQTQGKGTHGRTWYTQKGNIAFSCYIETNCKPQKLENITVEIAKILVKIFERNYDIHLEIKEPNDLMFNNKKIGGILTQSKIHADVCKYLVVGIGINNSTTKFDSKIENIATSIKNEFDIKIDRELIIKEFCNYFEKQLNNL